MRSQQGNTPGAGPTTKSRAYAMPMYNCITPDQFPPVQYPGSDSNPSEQHLSCTCWNVEPPRPDSRILEQRSATRTRFLHPATDVKPKPQALPHRQQRFRPGQHTEPPFRQREGSRLKLAFTQPNLTRCYSSRQLCLCFFVVAVSLCCWGFCLVFSSWGLSVSCFVGRCRPENGTLKGGLQSKPQDEARKSF